MKDASTNRACAKWWRRQQNWEAAKQAMEDSELAVTNYIARIRVDMQYYGVVIGGPEATS